MTTPSMHTLCTHYAHTLYARMHDSSSSTARPHLSLFSTPPKGSGHVLLKLVGGNHCLDERADVTRGGCMAGGRKACCLKDPVMHTAQLRAAEPAHLLVVRRECASCIHVVHRQGNSAGVLPLPPGVSQPPPVSPPLPGAPSLSDRMRLRWALVILQKVRHRTYGGQTSAAVI
jgi:hypothetical protein